MDAASPKQYVWTSHRHICAQRVPYSAREVEGLDLALALSSPHRALLC